MEKEKTRITFYDFNTKVICSTIVEKGQWDWETIFDRFSRQTIIKIIDSFIDYHECYMKSDPNMYTHLYTDLQYFFRMIDEFAVETWGFIEIEDFLDKSITIRELYEKAKERGLLDYPIALTYYCYDDWYNISNREINASEIDFDKGVNIVLE